MNHSWEKELFIYQTSRALLEPDAEGKILISDITAYLHHHQHSRSDVSHQ